ncbi:bifunctional Phosphatidylinositol-4-phosphate 5-kinase [Babesia duncani]|uniref:Bifunctional Phosphatidylinositol-4-phosphate 5-kinase n=1 Tax=Babesia duncani TaxID=323732 RepID=A0AAD9PIM7_9APIC|nr:bifunctional Phosphatidylinositol-4-phosphate 5-kinase [Babesia duncani]
MEAGFCGLVRRNLPARVSADFIATLQATLECSKSEIQQIYTRFRYLAPAGYLNLERFCLSLGLLGSFGRILAERIFLAFDSDDDGMLNFIEFAGSILTMLKGSKEQRLDLSFRIMAMRNVDYGITLQAFEDVISDVTTVQSLLIGHCPKFPQKDEIAKVFYQVASQAPDGNWRITRQDFENATSTNATFLSMLGASPFLCAIETCMGDYKRLCTRAPSLTSTIIDAFKYINKSNLSKRHDARKSGHSSMDHGPDPHKRFKRGDAVHFGHERWEDVINMMIGLGLAARRVYGWEEQPLEDEHFQQSISFGISETLLARVQCPLATTHAQDDRARLAQSSKTDENLTRQTPENDNLTNHVMPQKTNKTPRSSLLLHVHDTGKEGRQLVKVPGDKKEWSAAEIQAALSRVISEPKHADVVFKEYAPLVFKRIRTMVGLTERLYLESIGPEQLVGNLVLGNLSTMSELVSQGKSGALFYYTVNGRLILKSITKQCAKFIQSWLQDYYKHLLQHPKTLLTLFYGLFSLKYPHDRFKTYFVVMNNVFYSKVPIHLRFDIKGSWVGRKLPESERQDHTVALKDVDLDEYGESFDLGTRASGFYEAIKCDVAFLQESQILDYSLLLGIHNIQQTDSAYWANLEQQDYRCVVNASSTKVYYFCIIDVLTSWNVRKRLERLWRGISTLNNPGVSCVHPQRYAQRFLESLARHFMPSCKD